MLVALLVVAPLVGALLVGALLAAPPPDGFGSRLTAHPTGEDRVEPVWRPTANRRDPMRGRLVARILRRLAVASQRAACCRVVSDAAQPQRGAVEPCGSDEQQAGERARQHRHSRVSRS